MKAINMVIPYLLQTTFKADVPIAAHPISFAPGVGTLEPFLHGLSKYYIGRNCESRLYLFFLIDLISFVTVLSFSFLELFELFAKLALNFFDLRVPGFQQFDLWQQHFLELRCGSCSDELFV